MIVVANLDAAAAKQHVLVLCQRDRFGSPGDRFDA
jgi:hypothetical protein